MADYSEIAERLSQAGFNHHLPECDVVADCPCPYCTNGKATYETWLQGARAFMLKRHHNDNGIDIYKYVGFDGLPKGAAGKVTITACALHPDRKAITTVVQ